MSSYYSHRSQSNQPSSQPPPPSHPPPSQTGYQSTYWSSSSSASARPPSASSAQQYAHRPPGTGSSLPPFQQYSRPAPYDYPQDLYARPPLEPSMKRLYDNRGAPAPLEGFNDAYDSQHRHLARPGPPAQAPYYDMSDPYARPSSGLAASYRPPSQPMMQRSNYYDMAPPPPDPYSRSRDAFHQQTTRLSPQDPWRSPPPRFSASFGSQSSSSYYSQPAPSSSGHSDQLGFGPSNEMPYVRDRRDGREYAMAAPYAARTIHDRMPKSSAAQHSGWTQSRQRSLSPERRSNRFESSFRSHSGSSSHSGSDYNRRSIPPKGTRRASDRKQPPKMIGNAGTSDVQACESLGYPIPEPVLDIEHSDFNNESPLPLFPIRPPRQISPVLGATYRDTEANKGPQSQRKYPADEQTIRDPVRAIIEKSLITRQRPPKISANPADPRDNEVLTPRRGPMTGSTPGRGRFEKKWNGSDTEDINGEQGSQQATDGSLSIERIVKRMRDGEDVDGEDGRIHRSASGYEGKRLHLDEAITESGSPMPKSKNFKRSKSVKQSASAAIDPESATTQDLLQIVEGTLAQIRGNPVSDQ
ncbi:uncharacterized protein V1516DRAFT_120427 [Lipomyces oligophaga]|uniref:uncharacterized protein n=1 Tax=Lipomyces oligophaga TaxID=45792 RepID=UPI0034CEE1A4